MIFAGGTWDRFLVDGFDYSVYCFSIVRITGHTLGFGRYLNWAPQCNIYMCRAGG
jgi:hypothetical protein